MTPSGDIGPGFPDEQMADYSEQSAGRDEPMPPDAASPFGYCDRTGCDRPLTKFHVTEGELAHDRPERDAWCADGHRQMTEDDHDCYDLHLGKTVDTIQHDGRGDHDRMTITFTDGSQLVLTSGDSSDYQSCIKNENR